MADLPPLPLQVPTVGRRDTSISPRGKIRGPGAIQQAQRLSPSFRRLTEAFDAQRLQVIDDPAALEPEQILVLEIAGELDEFVRALKRIPGLEFLADEVTEKIDPDDFALVDRTGNRKQYARQLFLVATNASAWKELLRLWETYQKSGTFPHGLAQFRHLFERLRDLRPWGDRDRLERTGALEVWKRELADQDDELVEFEIELWLRSDPERREQVIADLRADLRAVGGELVDDFLLEDIDYHGVLGRVPARRLVDVTERSEVRWLRTGGIRLFHATGQMAAIGPSTEAEPVVTRAVKTPTPTGTPRVALLDGLPIENHVLLAGRLSVDDPDGWASLIPVSRRNHGTGMASVVVHGDLNDGGPPLPTPLYVRPILSTHAPAWVEAAPEELPRDRLPVDFIHTAVVRLFEGEAMSPGVKVIVLAIGDRAHQFDRFLSPLARLLDWLAFRYMVLFVVSAGNHVQDVALPQVARTGDPHDLQHDLLSALSEAAVLRRLLSPAESINALTVGAAHADSSTDFAKSDLAEPFVTSDLPNFGSATGAGVGRAVKPDILLPGGRQLVRLEPPSGSQQLVSLPRSRRPPGIKLATPGREDGILDAVSHDTGTSIAAATAGYHAGHLLEQLVALREIHGDTLLRADLDAVLVKAALVHTARWGEGAIPVLDARESLGLPRRREGVSRVLGYGMASPGSALACDDHLVTVFATNRVRADDAHSYSFPLPASLASRTERRRVTLTLAWLTPTNPRHRRYRRAALRVEPRGLQTVFGSRTEVDINAARRGTVQHEVMIGEQAVPFAPGSAIKLVVSCRADAGVLESDVPYALLLTVEVPATARLPIYEEVRQALRVPVTVRAGR